MRSSNEKATSADGTAVVVVVVVVVVVDVIVVVEIVVDEIVEVDGWPAESSPHAPARTASTTSAAATLPTTQRRPRNATASAPSITSG